MSDSKLPRAGNPSSVQLGRPRRFQDVEVFIAMARILQAKGYSRLTIEAVAGQVGCTGAALIARFGSKQGLLRAYLGWANTESASHFRQVREAHASPLGALRARFRLLAPEAGGEAGSSGWCLGLVVAYAVAWAEPGLREFEAARRALFTTEIVALLDDAVAMGELTECDTTRVGQTLIAALTGAALQAIATQDGIDNVDPLAVIETVIGPYCTTA